MASSSTRSKSRQSILGFTKELTKNVLPTCIFRANCFYRQNEEYLTSNDTVTIVATEVTEIYNVTKMGPGNTKAPPNSQNQIMRK